jgi:hypothetical protein
VVHQVQETVRRRLQWAGTDTDTVHMQAVLEALQIDRPGALIYAGSVIDYERLPYDERQRVKAARAIPYLHEVMRGKPVTEKQAACLRAMGYTGPSPADRADASALIDTLKRGGRP